MRNLTGTELADATHWMHEAATVAGLAQCTRKKCGSVIVADGAIIGTGYNAPPLDDMRNCKCNETHSLTSKPKYDKTCCMHAEWRAILDALRHNPEKIVGAQLFFTRVDDTGAIVHSGEPFCTVCSRLALDVGLKEFFLWHDDGICAYDTQEYNDLSYRYHQ